MIGGAGQGQEWWGRLGSNPSHDDTKRRGYSLLSPPTEVGTGCFGTSVLVHVRTHACIALLGGV